MDKMRMESVNMTAQNIEKIGALFPNCITETVDENGNPKKVINFELLKQMLSGEVLEGDEAYEFTWVGKKASIVEANKPIRKTLRPCLDESVDWDKTENLYIEGDNLEMLKLLQESYLGQVKMIYIDPPYNTGNDFIYNDDFKMSREEYEDDRGALDDSGNCLFKNTENNGRFHSDWCSMIYSRLMLARNLLRDDGVIMISIDDNEINNLYKICGEVFGESNFIATMIWQQGKKSSGNLIGVNHEYMVCFAKNANILDTPENAFRQKKIGLDKIYAYYNKMVNQFGDNYSKIQEEMKAFFASLSENDPAYSHRLYCLVDENGLYQSDNSAAPDRPESRSHRPLIHPKTGKPTAVPAMGWRFTDKKMDQLLSENRIHFGEDETKVPRVKRYLSEYEYEMPSTVFYKPGAAASSELQRLMGKKIFDNPKDRNEIQRIVGFCTRKIVKNPDEDSTSAYIEEPSDAIVLDFFSGSATTAHATMQLNAEDGGHRKFIMVQLPELCDEKSEAFKAGYKNICEIGKERIRRAGKKIKEESPLTTQDLDTGFRVLKIDDSNMTDVYYNPSEYSQDLLSSLESNIKPDRTDLDLLFGCLLEWGLPLSLPYSSEEIDGCTVHDYNDGDLIACFDENVPDSVVKAIAKKQPLRAVFRDSSFSDSPSKINVGEIFKLLAPDTRVKVI